MGVSFELYDNSLQSKWCCWSGWSCFCKINDQHTCLLIKWLKWYKSFNCQTVFVFRFMFKLKQHICSHKNLTFFNSLCWQQRNNCNYYSVWLYIVTVWGMTRCGTMVAVVPGVALVTRWYNIVTVSSLLIRTQCKHCLLIFVNPTTNTHNSTSSTNHLLMRKIKSQCCKSELLVW